MPVSRSFAETLNAAIADIVEHGFDSEGRITFWTNEIRKAAEKEMKSPEQMDALLRESLRAMYSKMVDQGQIARFHQGIGRFTIEKVRPQLRAELDRRIMASANLIKLNREKAMGDTLRRFQGWSTSIPAGGTDANKNAKTRADLKKALAQLPFEERRVLIDQGHKLNAALSEVLAKDGGAIAGIWHSHWRQAGYDYREDHKERDQKVYLMRNNWAQAAGLVKAGPAGYYDAITAVGEEPFCRCYMQWVYNLRSIPQDMLTQKGAAELQRVRAA